MALAKGFAPPPLADRLLLAAPNGPAVPEADDADAKGLSDGAAELSADAMVALGAVGGAAAWAPKLKPTEAGGGGFGLLSGVDEAPNALLLAAASCDTCCGVVAFGGRAPKGDAAAPPKAVLVGGRAPATVVGARGGGGAGGPEGGGGAALLNGFTPG